ncbi:hypothetical protein, partial [Streptomyces sp. FM008]|uniref:hypothetical protein n=1 Tax=Streptomyces sp. FM008 TaxID=1983802 RepID=UPI0011B03810
MARSPLHAPGPGSGRAARTARLLWPLALTLALATFLTGAALIARYGPVAPDTPEQRQAAREWAR